MEKPKQKTELGTIVGIIIVIILLIIGAYYIFNQRIEKQKEFQQYLDQLQENNYSSTTEIIEITSTSSTSSPSNTQ